MSSTLVKGLRVSLLIFLLYLAGCGGGGDGGGGAATGAIRLAWDPVTDPGLVGYKLHYGTAPNTYSNSIDVGMATQSGNAVTYTVTGLTQGQTYFIVVTAYDASRTESLYSNEVPGVAKIGL
jgi:fibronectin type III domain protein